MFKNLAFILLFFITLVAKSQDNFKLNTATPEFKLWLIDDSEVTNEKIKNKVVVFKFWFTSCPPCIEDIPKMNALVKEFENRSDILFIAPALDRKEAVLKLIKKFPFHFKIAYNSMDVSEVFNKKQVYPSYFVINKQGKFIYIDSDNKQSSFINLRSSILKALEI